MLAVRIECGSVNPHLNMDSTAMVPQSKMGLHVVASSCSAGSCPTIYRTDHGTLLVQGYMITEQTGVELPHGEMLVEIPVELLAEAARAVG
jgi:hypothetical protein